MLLPRVITFDFFGTTLNVRPVELAAFERILSWNRASHVNAAAFHGRWLRRCQDSFVGPYLSYKEICEEALLHTFSDFGVRGRSRDVDHYFECYTKFRPWPEVEAALEALADKCELAIITNCDDDLFALTKKPSVPYRYHFTAESANGYKPDGTLFRHAQRDMDVELSEWLHAGQSQRTDLVGAKPLGITVAWVNRYGLSRDADVPVPDYEVGDFDGLVHLLPPGGA
jgi:2-haloacid dehalogenase